ncbi:MAG: PAC2 family protein [Candidatus Woesearchaeota archaeon]
MKWEFTLKGKLPKLNKPILLEGLPGMGNVGKVVVDFLIDDLKAKKVYDIFSYRLPHTVFVNEKNLVELPSIELYYKTFNNPKKNDLLLLAGDVQPSDEESSYMFCEQLLDIIKTLDCREIITIGGIGLQDVPKKPKVYCTGNAKDIVQKYIKDTKASGEIYGVVGPIIGVSGLLVGLAKKRKIDAVAMLAETIAHPMYLGVKGAREVLKIIEKKLELKINIKELDKEIKNLEKEILKTTQELSQISKETAISKLKRDVSYIG